MNPTGSRRWVAQVKTDSTHPSGGLFTREPGEIARVMASPRVSPGGIGSAIRMVQFFINRGGKGLPATRRHRLERAKQMLQQMRRHERATARASHARAGARRARGRPVNASGRARASRHVTSRSAARSVAH